MVPRERRCAVRMPPPVFFERLVLLNIWGVVSMKAFVKYALASVALKAAGGEYADV